MRQDNLLPPPDYCAQIQPPWCDLLLPSLSLLRRERKQR